MVRRTKEEAQETRNRILDTAEEVFREQGVTSTSLADIADAAGVTRGAIYWHFRNKGDLFAAMLDRVALPMEEMIRRAADVSTADPLSSLRACCVQVLRQTAEDVRCRRVFEILTRKCEYVDELHGLSQRILQCRTQGLEMMQQALCNSVRRGQLPPRINAARAALGLHGRRRARPRAARRGCDGRRPRVRRGLRAARRGRARGRIRRRGPLRGG